MRSTYLAITVLPLFALAACGGSDATDTASSSDQALEGASFVVSSKDFTESILLGKITAAVLSAHGAEITDKTNIKGSVNTRSALTSSEVDMYWEYTGTAWISYQKNAKPIADPVEQYQEVKTADAAEGVAWLDAAPLNNTYAMAIRSSEAEALGVESLSDLGELSKTNPSAATFCIESEFSTRDDGFPGMTEAYGIEAADANVKMLDTG